MLISVDRTVDWTDGRRTRKHSFLPPDDDDDNMTSTLHHSPGIPIAEDVGGRAGVYRPDRIHVLETVIVQSRGGVLLRESLEYRLDGCVARAVFTYTR